MMSATFKQLMPITSANSPGNAGFISNLSSAKIELGIVDVHADN